MAKQSITYDPQVLDLGLYAGDGTSFRLVVTDAAGAPVNLTGSMIAQIRTARDSQDPPVTSFNIDLSQSVEGIAGLKLTGDQTQMLGKFSGVWDLQWTPIDTEPVTLCQGKVECILDVSH